MNTRTRGRAVDRSVVYFLMDTFIPFQVNLSISDPFIMKIINVQQEHLLNPVNIRLLNYSFDIF